MNAVQCLKRISIIAFSDLCFKYCFPSEINKFTLSHQIKIFEIEIIYFLKFLFLHK